MGHIIIADEDMHMAEILGLILEGEGHTHSHSADGASAHEMVLSEQPDLVLLSRTLPVFDGLETCSKLRDDPEVPAHLPIFVLSSTEIGHDAIRKSGATDVLSRASIAAELPGLLIRHLPADALPEPGGGAA